MDKKKTLLLTLMTGLSLVSANTQAMPEFAEKSYEFFVSEHPLETACGVTALVVLSWYTQKPAMIWNLLKDTKSKAVCPHNVEVGNVCRDCRSGKAIAVCPHDKIIGKWCRWCVGGVAIAARKSESRSRTPEVTCAHGKVLGKDCDSCRGGTATVSKRRSESPAKEAEAPKKRKRRRKYDPYFVTWKCRHGVSVHSRCKGGDSCVNGKAVAETCEHGKGWSPFFGSEYCEICGGYIDPGAKSSVV